MATALHHSMSISFMFCVVVLSSLLLGCICSSLDDVHHTVQVSSLLPRSSCKSSFTPQQGKTPGYSSSTCVSGIQYEDSSYSVKFFGKDLTLTSTEAFDNFLFRCGQNNRGLFGGAAGLLGLGRDKLSLVQQTSSKNGKYFSYCRPSSSSSTGHLTFGRGSGASSSVKFTPLATISQGDNFYGINIEVISVGGTKLSISSSIFSNAPGIIDSGTVITHLPRTACSALSSAFKKLMTRTPTAPDLLILDTCYDLSKYSSVTIPKVSFLISGGTNVDLDPSGILFASARVDLGNGNDDSSMNNGDSDNGAGGVLVDDGVHVNGVEADTPKKVLILMSDTGGGHRASAEAIKAAFHEEFGDDYQVFITDMWSDHTPWPFNQLPRSYNFLVKYGPLWKMTFYASAPRIVHQSIFAATSTLIAREVAEGLMKYQPDIIISVHPLMQHVPLRILRAKGLLKKIIFATVVTDLSTCHPTWFHKLVTRCYCPSAEVAKRALKAGLQPSQIKVYGLPVRPSFVKPVRPKDELRRELGMDEDLPAVLLMGGGEGMGPIEATARALGDALYDEHLMKPIGQILIICGRNKKLANRLLSIDWKIPVQVKGFVTKMEECMGACDCIITKAGPGTIAEAMIRGLPIILNDYIAGQEVGNVPYVVDNGFGKFSKSPKEIANIVAEWFGPKADELKAMSQNALKLAGPDAVFKIVHDLDELVKQRSFVPQYNTTQLDLPDRVLRGMV